MKESLQERWRLNWALKEKAQLGSWRGVSQVEGTDNANPQSKSGRGKELKVVQQSWGLKHNVEGGKTTPRSQAGLSRWCGGKQSTCKAGNRVQPPGQDLSWRRKWQPTPVPCLGDPWTEEPGGPQSTGSQSQTRLSGSTAMTKSSRALGPPSR